MTDEPTIIEDDLIGLTTDIVAAYVSHNSVAAADLSKLIADTHAALRGLGTTPSTEVTEKLAPAVPTRKSVTPDFLVCLEDGKKFKSLKRHLATHHHLTPEKYREKWGLPQDYPMTAPSYSATRSALAKANGLGRTARVPTAEVAPAKAPRKKLGLKFS